MNYIKDTLDWINKNTDLINHEEGLETYSNLMMNCENIITGELALFDVSSKRELLIAYELRECENPTPLNRAVVECEIDEYISNL